MTTPELPTEPVYIFTSLAEPNDNYSGVGISLTLNRKLSFAEHEWIAKQGESLGYKFEFPEAPSTTIRSVGLVPTMIAEALVKHIIGFLAQLPDAAGELHSELLARHGEVTDAQLAIAKIVIDAQPKVQPQS